MARIPRAWWPRYLLKKLFSRTHWSVGRTRLLSHPGCLLSYTRPVEPMLTAVKKAVASQKLTVLVTHWWEYFRLGHPDEPFIDVLHQTAEYLASQPDICVISFEDVIMRGKPRRAATVAPIPATAAVSEAR